MNRAWLLVAVMACSARDEPEVPELTLPSLELTSGGVADVSALDMPAPRGMGTLVVRISDEQGHPIPGRLTFLGIEGTKTPMFTRADIGIPQPGGILAFDRAFVVGSATLAVPAGSYEVWFSHGPEWDAASRRIHIGHATMASATVTLRHVVDTPGWISGDFHVHAERSFDSKVPMAHRIYQFLADGVDLIVATDHDVIADYAPIIERLGQKDRIASLQGDEITTHDWGHFGGFPLSGTAPVTKSRNPASLFAEVRERWPAAIIDVHHPRLDKGKMGYFHLGELDTKALRSKRPGFSFDFDAVEVLNGFQDPDRASVDAVLADWFSFLRRGHRITGTGNSDTHHLTFNLGGYPRNYVLLPDAPLDQLDAGTLTAAVKAGRSFFTTGPIIEVSAGEQRLGDTVSTHGEPVDLHILVRAPGWIDVDRVSVLVDGIKVFDKLVTGSPPVRFDDTVSIPMPVDGFVIVRVDGDSPMAPIVGDNAHFKVYPLAITNPIWVDTDGDGEIHPSVTD